MISERRTAARSVRLAALLTLAGSAGVLFAQDGDPIVTDRPDFTESTPTIERGRFQLEGGATLARSAGDVEERSLGELLLRAGVAERLELRLAANLLDSSPGGSGLDDPGIGVKLRLLEPVVAAAPEMSLILETTVPVGGEEVAERAWQPGAKLLLAWVLPWELSLGSNWNYARASADGVRHDELGASLTVGRPLAGPVSGFLEVYAVEARHRRVDDERIVNGGVTWLVTPGLQLDARVGTALGEDGPDLVVGIGAAARW